MALFDDIYRPDFMASTQLPEWVNMDQVKQPDFSGLANPLVDLLKKRKSKSGGIGGAMGGTIGQPTAAPHGMSGESL